MFLRETHSDRLLPKHTVITPALWVYSLLCLSGLFPSLYLLTAVPFRRCRTKAASELVQHFPRAQPRHAVRFLSSTLHLSKLREMLVKGYHFLDLTRVRSGI